MTAARVLARCDELAGVSQSPDGIARHHLTPEHAAANRLVGGWMRAAGLVVSVDAAGNLRGSRGPGPRLLMGSHLDTVPDAGRYDGPLGVLLAIEVAARLPNAPVEVLAFSGEEGTRFGQALLGSSAAGGRFDEAWLDLVDADDITVREALKAFGGGDPATAAVGPSLGYLEVHIEQGPLLEDAGLALGVVTSIAAATRLALTIHGAAGHAGTPYDRRRDALAGAAEFVLAAERVGRARGIRATVGQTHAYPGAVNVVPGRVELSLDLRAATDGELAAAQEELTTQLGLVCDRRDLTWDARTLHRAAAAPCAPALRAAFADGVRSTGQAEVPELFSPAGHDAMAMAPAHEIGMLFVRCRGGVSHDRTESVEPGDVGAALVAFEYAARTVLSHR